MWHNGIIDGYWWEAKVYNEGSHFGINNGRISKLAICKGSVWDSTNMVYNYDRGLDVNSCPTSILEKIIAHCEALPKG